jgi:hypothetical protein
MVLQKTMTMPGAVNWRLFLILQNGIVVLILEGIIEGGGMQVKTICKKMVIEEK